MGPGHPSSTGPQGLYPVAAATDSWCPLQWAGLAAGLGGGQAQGWGRQKPGAEEAAVWLSRQKEFILAWGPEVKHPLLTLQTHQSPKGRGPSVEETCSTGLLTTWLWAQGHPVPLSRLGSGWVQQSGRKGHFCLDPHPLFSLQWFKFSPTPQLASGLSLLPLAHGCFPNVCAFFSNSSPSRQGRGMGVTLSIPQPFSHSLEDECW